MSGVDGVGDGSFGSVGWWAKSRVVEAVGERAREGAGCMEEDLIKLAPIYLSDRDSRTLGSPTDPRTPRHDSRYLRKFALG